MIVSVDPSSPVPPFEQLRAAISRLVVSGELQVGARLPTVRQLAVDLGLAPGTVARSYRELEAEGILVTRGRHGTHVGTVPAPPSRAERQRRLAEAASAYALTVRELGVDLATAVEQVTQTLATTGAGLADPSV